MKNKFVIIVFCVCMGISCKKTDNVSVKLENGRNELEFRTVNFANEPGPPHKVVIQKLILNSGKDH